MSNTAEMIDAFAMFEPTVTGMSNIEWQEHMKRFHWFQDQEAKFWFEWATRNGREDWEKAKLCIEHFRGEQGLKNLTHRMNELRLISARVQ